MMNVRAKVWGLSHTMRTIDRVAMIDIPDVALLVQRSEPGLVCARHQMSRDLQLLSLFPGVPMPLSFLCELAPITQDGSVDRDISRPV